MINDEDHPTMQVQVDESAGPEHGVELIMSALIAVSSPVTELWDPPEVSETLPDESERALLLDGHRNHIVIQCRFQNVTCGLLA